MADIFISYAREDRAWAERIARGLGAMGLEVFWDTDIPPGQTWADYIEGKLTQCRAVIVLWSQHSTKSQWVREEARMGREKAKLIPVMLDGSPAPFGFGEVQAADLSAWSGDPNHSDWVRFSRAAYATARGGDAPPPPAAPQPQAAWSAPPPAAQGWNDPRVSSATASGVAENLSPLGYIQKCFRLYADGKGRARRAEYGWFVLFQVVLVIVAFVVDSALYGFNTYSSTPNGYLATWLLLGIVAPAISAASRRAHDVGQSGWLAVLTIIPYVGWIAVLALIFIPGQPGQNQHGPNPKGQ